MSKCLGCNADATQVVTITLRNGHVFRDELCDRHAAREAAHRHTFPLWHSTVLLEPIGVQS